MAKQTDRQESLPISKSDHIRIAQELFIKLWNPNSGRSDEHMAANCFKAAGAFCRVASQVSEGRSPEELIS